jgi:hypothetical protein
VVEASSGRRFSARLSDLFLRKGNRLHGNGLQAMKLLKEYLRALNHGKELERLTIINWLEEVDQIDAFGDTDVKGIIEALKEEIHKRRD